ncbi:MAG: DUF192 domain-containing protein [Clostridiaceae bacterium]
MGNKILKNEKNGAVVLKELKIASTFWSRFMGLMGKIPAIDEGLLIKPCNSIHCFFMKVPIDVLFIDDENIVVKKIDSMKPWRVSPIVLGSKAVIEANAGVFKDINEGDKLSIQ